MRSKLSCPEFIIRGTKKEDYLQVKDFIKLVDNDFYPPLSKREEGICERIERSLDTSDSNFIVASLTGSNKEDPVERFIAVAGYTKNWKSDDDAYINFLATHPQHRNAGVSKSLCLRLEEELIEQDVKTIYLCTWSGNPAAIKFYEKLGYHSYTILLNDRGNGIDTIYYKKRIQHILVQNNDIKSYSKAESFL